MSSHAPIVILSPHCDDAPLSCWSVLTSNADVRVVNFFTGAPEPGVPVPYGEELTGSGDPAARARERAEEDAQALAVAGRRGLNLDLLEYAHWLEAHERRPLRPLRTALHLLLGRDPERGRLKEVAARGAAIDRHSHVYAPAGLGAHPDHVLVRDFACGLLREGVTVSFYADQPYCYVYGWPHWVLGEDRDPYMDVALDWRRQLEEAPLDFDRLQARPVRLDDAGWQEKLRALRLYRSQFAALEGGPNRRLSNPELTGWEVFWDAAPAQGRQHADAAARIGV